MAVQEKAILENIDALLASLNGGEKSASEITTGTHPDPGGRSGKSTHPVAKADGNTQTPPLGSRAKENEKDIKSDIPAGGIDASSENSGDQTSQQISIGMKQTLTGEDPATEDRYKGDKDDPGTSHPADAESTGEKYSSWSVEKLEQTSIEQFNNILAAIAAGDRLKEKKAEATPATEKKSEQQLAAQAGYELAGFLHQVPSEDQQQQEKIAICRDLIADTIKSASDDASRVGNFLASYAQQKQAMGNDPLTAMMGAADGESGGAPALPPEAAPANPEVPMGEGTELGGEMGGEMGGGMGEEEILNELANALIEAGISPEQLIASLEQGGEAAPAPEAAMPLGGEETPAEESAEEEAKVAADRAFLKQAAGRFKQVVKHMRSGKFRIKEAKKNTKTRQERDEVISFVREVCNK